MPGYTPKHNVTSKKYHLFLILLIFGILAASSFAWDEWQSDSQNRGFDHAITGEFDQVGTVLSTNIGSDFQPLILDFDDDDDSEIILFTTTFISVQSNTLSTEYSLNIGSTILSQPTSFVNNSKNLIALLITDTLKIYSYNVTSINEVGSVAINTTQDSVTGITESNNFLYFGSQINTTHSNIYKIRTDNFTIINTSLIVGNVTHNLAVGDINIDSIDDVAFVCDVDNNGDFGLCVFDSATMNYKTSFSVDGIIDDLQDIGDSRFIRSPIMYNLDSGIDTEIIMAYSEDGTCGVGGQYIPVVESFNSDGSSYWKSTTTGTCNFPDNFLCCDASNYATYLSQPFIAFNDDDASVCLYNDGRETLGDSTKRFGCLNRLTGVKNWSFLTDVSVKTENVLEIGISSGASYFETIPGIEQDFSVFGQYLFQANGSLRSNITQVDGSYEYGVADVNSDNNPEIIYSSSSTTKIVFSNFSNQPPVVNNSQRFGGFGADLDYETPICVGSTVTFKAQECGGVIANCNYDNDVASDEERIASNCGQLASGLPSASFTSTLDNGTPDGSNPSFQCVYNLTGIFSVRLYLQDQANQADFSEFNSQTIVANVINGTAGITCNLGGAISPGDTGSDALPANVDNNNEAIEDTLGILFGSGSGSDSLKLIVGIALILGIIAAAYREGVRDGVAIIVIAGFATLLVTLIGLVTPAVFILALALLLLIVFVGRALTGGSPNGSG